MHFVLQDDTRSQQSNPEMASSTEDGPHY